MLKKAGLLFFLAPSFILGSYYEYLYPYSKPSFSNYGSIGLIQNPTSRFHDEGTLALSWTHNEPYLRGSLIAYPFNWMEASFQYTDINNALYSPFESFSGSQSLKDKSFDIKFRLFKESVNFPSISVGLRDIGGTGLFSSEYIVANKFVLENLDISFGIGWGNLTGNSVRNPLIDISDNFQSRDPDFGLGGKLSTDSFFSGDAGLFGGLEYYFQSIKGLRFKAEFDGTNYDLEGVEPLEQKSNINIGFVYPISNNFFLKLSSNRGNTINFGFSYSLNLGDKYTKKIIKNKRRPIDNNNIIKIVTEKNNNNLYLASLRYLSEESFFLQRAAIDQNVLRVEFANSKFRNPVIASGRAIKILDEISPMKIEKFKIATVNGGVGINLLEIDRADFNRSEKNNYSTTLLRESIKLKPYNPSAEKYEFIPSIKYPKSFNSIGPDLKSQIGGPDGFFFADLKLGLNSEILFSKNTSLVIAASYGLYDNMDELKLPSNSVLPHVRTEIVNYLKESRDFSIQRFQVNHFGQIRKSIFYKFTGGILESMFSGVGGEILYKPFDRNFAIGLEAWSARQRDYDQLFNHQNYETNTGHLTFYYLDPNSRILFKIKGGRYLAKDSGMTFDASRAFNNGVKIGAFFTLTDISAEEFGEGSFDKGFYFHIPVDVFSRGYFKRNFGWGLRPITRDGGQSIIHGYPLWGVTNQAHSDFYNQSLNKFYE